jgi:hypothetical protein
MPFQTDERLAAGEGKPFGEYLTTFVSNTGQVRADFFMRNNVLTAHVSFPSGLDAGSVTDPYVHDVWQYARDKGLADRFKLVYS